MTDFVMLVGPTASGKTALSVQLAKELNGEIISGDSMQFYRGMDIGTAKVTPQEMQGVPHHLIDILEPDQPYSVADFQRDCYRLVEEISSRGRLPILAGGTALYVKAVMDGYTFSQEASGDDAFRRQKEQEALGQPIDYLHLQLQAVDPAAAAKLHPKDQRRIIRALEVYQRSGAALSSQAGKNPPGYRMVLLGIQMERQLLYQRIDQRVDAMIAAGLEQETKSLLAAGYSRELKPMQGLGYRQMCAYLAGEIDFTEAVRLIKRDTRHFAKRQLTWWRQEPRVHWLDAPSHNLALEGAGYIRDHLR